MASNYGTKSFPHYGQDDVADAMKALNFHPDASPYWDSPEAQEVLRCAKYCGLKAQNTNKERCNEYARVAA